MNASPSQSRSMPSNCVEFAFREIRTVDEMRQVLALRYEVYSQTEVANRLASLDHESRLEADAFDLYSHHFGLFCRRDRIERVVGTLRITADRPSPIAWALGEIASGHPTVASRLAVERRVPLPMFSYLEQFAIVREQYDRLVASGARVAEAGRFTVHPALRSATDRSGVRLSHFVILCAHAFAWNIARLDQVFVDCDARLEALYRRFGFGRVPGFSATVQPAFGVKFAALFARPDMLPSALRLRIETLAGQILRQGEAILSNRDEAPAADLPGPAEFAPVKGGGPLTPLGRSSAPVPNAA